MNGVRQAVARAVAVGLFVVGGAALAMSDDPARIASSLSQFFKEDKLQVSVIGPLVVIDGEVETPAELVRVDRIAQGLRESNPAVAVKSLVKVSPRAMSRMAEIIERNIGSTDITARFVANRLMIEGVADNDFEADRAVEVAKAFLADFPVVTRSAGTPKAGRDAASVATDAADRGVWIIDLLRIRPRAAPKPKR
jgi:Flp pilus assembly secretin CpaC